MERERFYAGQAGEQSLVPDTIPDELVAAHQADARAVVAATVAPERAARLWDDHASPRAGFPARMIAAACRATRPASRGQRIQAVLALLAGYLGLASLTAWWWTLAQPSGDSLWWTVTAVGAGGLAVATLALLRWVAVRLARLARRRRRRVTAGTGR